MNFPFKKQFKYYKFYKPFGILSQFTPDHPGQASLKDLLDVDKDVYPIGRLDKDSEGLLLLSNDPALNAWILNPSNKKKKIYWVQLEGKIQDKAIQDLQDGITIRAKGKEHFVKAQSIKIIETDPELPERIPPIRERKNIPTSWCEIEISEGKNRQVRRMFAKVNYPVLRLVRVQIDSVHLGKMKPGELQDLA